MRKDAASLREVRGERVATRMRAAAQQRVARRHAVDFTATFARYLRLFFISWRHFDAAQYAADAAYATSCR